MAATLQGPTSAAYNWDANRYFDNAVPERGGRFTFGFNGSRNEFGGGRLRFSEWVAATGFDRTSQYAEGWPTGTECSCDPTGTSLGVRTLRS